MLYDILIVDDQEDIRVALANILQDEGYKTHQAIHGIDALEQLKKKRPHLIILDIWFNDARLDGMQTLERIKQLYADIPVVMISGHSTIETAVAALHKGAYDFIEKPFKADRLLNIIRRGVELSSLYQELQILRQSNEELHELTGTSAQTIALQQTIERVAKTNSRIMLEGPSGVGKEVVARLIHKKSHRSHYPFIVVNCANLAPERLEEELFGKETRIGALEVSLKIGLLEKADRGTLFLDGVHDMPLETQGKILQVLHEQCFYRLNSTHPTLVDIRIISSTSISLVDQIQKGKFREDLYYRLNVVPIKVPPLHQRREDIVPLAIYFLDKANPTKEKRYFSEDAKTALESYTWPGNVRQLKNTMEWISIMHPTSQEITAQMLPAEARGLPPSSQQSIGQNALLVMQIKQAREEFEKVYLELHIKRFNGNISKTAQAVGMERTALHRKIKTLNLISES